MATTGTYAFNPSAGDVVMNAFALCRIPRVNLTTEHYENASFQANLLGVDFTNRNPNRWQMVELPFVLVDNVKTYSLPPQVCAVAAVWIDQVMPNPDASPISRVLGPLSAVEYASLSNKDQQGTPTSYFFSLLTPIPTLTLWLVPNDIPTYTMRVQAFQQQQDTSVRNGATPDVPFRFLDALTFGLAERLAAIYAPELRAELKMDYKEKFNLAAQLDQERVSLKLAPNLSSYYR